MDSTIAIDQHAGHPRQECVGDCRWKCLDCGQTGTPGYLAVTDCADYRKLMAGVPDWEPGGKWNPGRYQK